MTKRNHLSALCIIGTLAMGGAALADDGDVQHARILHEEAQTYGVPGITGQAAGQIEAEREERRQQVPEVFNEDEQRWEDILQAQSLN